MIPIPLALADLGYRVFPCVPGGKRPITEHGLLEATSDAETISAWLAQHPTANWAISTDGLLVLDVDCDGSENLWFASLGERANELAGAPAVRTPRGGRHFYFRQPDGSALRNTTARLAEKVDTRANGGYVVVPPSTVNGNAYTWVSGELDGGPESLPLPPAWLLDALAAVAVKPAPAVAADPGDGTIADGRRNSSLTSLAGAMRRLGAPEAEL